MSDLSKTNTLLSRLIDSCDGYEQAAKRADGHAFQAKFQTIAAERAGYCSELRAALTGAGASPAEDGSILASAHRTFLSLRDMVQGSDDQAIVAEIVRGEEALVEAYDDAIAETAGHGAFGFLKTQRETVSEELAEWKTRDAA